MSKNVVMIGNGSYSQTLSYYIENKTDWKIVAYADEYEKKRDAIYDGLPMINLEDLPEMYPASDFEVVIGVGYCRMNENRKRIYETIKNMGYKFPNFVHPSVILNNASLGEANVIMENVIFEPYSVMGNNNIVWSGVIIGHNVEIGNHNQLSAGGILAGCSKVEDNCFLGVHATVRDGTKLAHHTFVGPNTYVNVDTKPKDLISAAKAQTIAGMSMYAI